MEQLLLWHLLSQNAVFLGEPDDAVVGFSHAADGSAHHVHLGGVGGAAGGGVHVGDHQLHGRVVLGVDEPVAGRAGTVRWHLRILDRYCGLSSGIFIKILQNKQLVVPHIVPTEFIPGNMLEGNQHVNKGQFDLPMKYL